MRLICKKTGEDVRDLKITIKYSDSYSTESDSLFDNHMYIEILYKTKSYSDTYEINREMMSDYKWIFLLLMNDKITNNMIQESKEIGPFIIVNDGDNEE